MVTDNITQLIKAFNLGVYLNLKNISEQYLKNLTDTSKHGDAREESYYKHLDILIKEYSDIRNIEHVDITILPKKTEAGNPDFRIWDGTNHITGYIEAKSPSTNLDYIEGAEQLERYISTFPNIILTNFYEFRLYRNGQRIAQAMIGRPVIATELQITPPIENIEKFGKLLDLFFSFSLPKAQTAHSLAVELAKRTRFLRDQVIAVEIEQNSGKGHEQITAFYEAFKKYLISALTEKQFADIYAQTITYGLFAARTRTTGIFNRKAAFDLIPHTIGILRDIFRFISLEEPPQSLQIIAEDIAEILNAADTDKILSEYRQTGKGRDPIIHFYETFLNAYDPEIRERRGVYYTPEPVVSYIVRSVHSILKSHFQLPDGLADKQVKLLDPAGGTLTFPAEAIRIAADEFKSKYGEGGLHSWIENHILAHFYAFELMMAPYAIGHLKIGFILDELGYKISDDQRFKLYLTNTMEMEDIQQIALPGLSSLSRESYLAGKLKKEQPILVILGNPPYSGMSANINQWTERLLKEDINGTQSYYKADKKPLCEKNPKWLQDDYVKFLRFAQWKIQTAGYGIAAMITNHSYLDNPTFRGMRQSLIKTFDEIYILDLHGNSLKKETTPDGGKDENIFDIRQGTAIAIFIKNKTSAEPKVFHADIYGLRKEKYNWLNNNDFLQKNYSTIKPQTPYYFLVKKDTAQIKRYLKWKPVTEIFPVSSVGIVTARDKLTIKLSKQEMWNTILNFSKIEPELARTAYKLGKDARDWKVELAQKDLQDSGPDKNKIYPILYRPFDIRYTYYTGKSRGFHCRPRFEVMRHMLRENKALITIRRSRSSDKWNLAFVSDKLTAGATSVTSLDINYIFPLYLYPDNIFDNQPEKKEPNIAAAIFQELSKNYKNQPNPEEIFHYVYGIFYSNTYRETYAEFLKIDFPRIPFTADYDIFKQISELGKQLADLHLLKSPLLNPPTAKYRGTSANNRIEKIIYKKNMQRIYINKDKYFEGIEPEVWDYYIGGYQVLQKYLKDRKNTDIDDAPHYCLIAAAVGKTIEIQKKIDELYIKLKS